MWFLINVAGAVTCFPNKKALRKAAEKGGADSNIFSTYFSSCPGDSPPPFPQ
jgi:hypothetical protein